MTLENITKEEFKAYHAIEEEVNKLRLDNSRKYAIGTVSSVAAGIGAILFGSLYESGPALSELAKNVDSNNYQQLLILYKAGLSSAGFMLGFGVIGVLFSILDYFKNNEEIRELKQTPAYKKLME